MASASRPSQSCVDMIVMSEEEAAVSAAEGKADTVRCHQRFFQTGTGLSYSVDPDHNFVSSGSLRQRRVAPPYPPRSPQPRHPRARPRATWPRSWLEKFSRAWVHFIRWSWARVRPSSRLTPRPNVRATRRPPPTARRPRATTGPTERPERPRVHSVRGCGRRRAVVVVNASP